MAPIGWFAAGLAVTTAVLWSFSGAPLVGLIFASSASGGTTGLAKGRRIYDEHCAACHGRQLEGQPDWQRRLPSGRLPAPPHDASGHTWHHSDKVLFRITKQGPAAIVGGGYESDMPGFGDVLSDAEIRAVIDFIKSTWPERERKIQERMNQQEKGSGS
ncbi:MAG: cytochrome c [Alphaproteobacteria bacterium]|nr:cytochrome c [Alphaproteobacteria bacterium]